MGWSPDGLRAGSGGDFCCLTAAFASVEIGGLCVLHNLCSLQGDLARSLRRMLGLPLTWSIPWSHDLRHILHISVCGCSRLLSGCILGTCGIASSLFAGAALQLRFLYIIKILLRISPYFFQFSPDQRRKGVMGP